MYARVLSRQQAVPSAAQRGEVVRSLREQVLPPLRATPGFLGAYVLTETHTGTTLALTLWESDAALQDGAAAATAFEAACIPTDGGAGPTGQRYEVVVAHVPEGVDQTYARVSQGPIPPANLEGAIRATRERSVPQLAVQPGFAGYYGLVDRAASTVVSLSFWESDAALAVSDAAAATLREQVTQMAGGGEQGLVVVRYAVDLQA